MGIPKLKPIHKYAGITFMLSMYFVEGSSILIYNTGLPRAIIIFLAIMLITMVSGYSAIKVHQVKFQTKVNKLADELSEEKDYSLTKVSELLKMAKEELLSRPRKWYERLFSLKALHGYLMTLAWYQMAGRAGVTNPFNSWEHCYVYPVCKELGENGELILYSGITDEEKQQQLEFAAYIEIPAFIIFAVVSVLLCIGYAYWTKRKQRNKENSLLA